MMFLPNQRLGVMAALPEELQSVLDALTEVQTIERGGRTFWVGHWHGVEVVAVLSRIGKVAAAITTTLLLTEMACAQIVFTGVAGGLGEGVRVGDVVVANALVQHDMDASPLFPRHELPGLGVSHLKPDAALAQHVTACVTKALSADALAHSHVLQASHLSDLGLSWPRVHQGLIASGDQFVSDAGECVRLRHELPDVLAVEMEGAAVAQVCHDFGVPYVILRTISDRADDAAHLDFPRFANAVACKYARVMIESLICAS